MSKFEVVILPIDKVEKHPSADRLSLNHIRGYVAISNKQDDGSHRYQPGQLVAYIPLSAVVPDSLLKARGYWDDKRNKGFLGGPKGNIVAPINLRGVVSRGLIFPTELIDADSEYDFNDYPYIRNGDGHLRMVRAGDNVTEFLGIKQHTSLFQFDGNFYVNGPTLHYQIEDLRKFPDLLNDEQVVITELLHGIACVVGYDRTLHNPFFVANGFGNSIDVDSSNIYTQIAKPIWEQIKRYLVEMPAVEKFYIFGTIIGPGIQDITYGLDAPEFRALDIQMGLMGGGLDSIPFGFIGVRKYELFKWLGIPTAPILWGCIFSQEIVEKFTNGPSSIGGGLRKGVVITSESEKLVGGIRPILKNISDKYLLRVKGTEYK